MNMLKGLKVMTVTAGMALLLGACSESDVNTGAKETAKAPKATEAKAEGKSIDASAQTITAAGLIVNLAEIRITDDKISVGINIENTSEQDVSFYPDQGSIVIGDMQLSANMFMTSGDIGGDVLPGVKQDAVLEFLAPDGKSLDPAAITEIKLALGDVTTGDFMTSEPVNFTVPTK